MNKNAIQKYAIWARNELIEQVKQRAFQYGIDEKGYGDENAAVIAGRVLSEDEKRQRRFSRVVDHLICFRRRRFSVHFSALFTLLYVEEPTYNT